jgi:hypothetical protein
MFNKESCAMNYARIVLAAVAATVVDAVYGFAVYGMLLVNEFARYPAVYRTNEAGMAYLPLMFAGIFIGMVVAAMIYAKGYEGGSGIAEGVRFGVLLGLFMAAVFGSVNYATLNIGRRLSLELAVAGFVEWTLAGIAIGLVYKPGVSAARRTARV